MRYLVMVQGSQADYDAMNGRASAHSPAWSEEDLRAMFAFMGKIGEDLAASGELIDANGLAEPAQTLWVSSGPDGVPVITDDPYGETTPLPAGYWVLDCATPERVTEIAARITHCPGPEGLTGHPVVIRPILDSGAEAAGGRVTS
ncbi:hypothetical protein V7793_20480 [Streptomyces sp. KLMMK]|uniref:YciI family protein n=1 Tax=Streptomyces sp. KLMMK TaxID=3109353 RepID=UPI0030091C71